MGKNVAGTVALEARLVVEDGKTFLCVDVANRSPEGLSLVCHPNYWTVELRDGNGQFVRGRPTGTQDVLPASADYRLIAAGGAEKGALRLPIMRAGERGPLGEYAIGGRMFPPLPSRTALRVLYKASEQILPNMPNKRRGDFFGGPAESPVVDVDLP